MLSDGKKVIGLIPARGGSKGIARKNLLPILGKPLIQYTIEAALNSKYIDEILVSSEDEEILAFAQKFPRVRALRRPEEFAADSSSPNEVVSHIISMGPFGVGTEDPLLVYLQPTSPLRTGAHIDASLDMLRLTNTHRLISVTEVNKSPFKSFKLDLEGKLISLFEEGLSNARRQDLPITYHPNGAIYVFTAQDFLMHGSFPSNGSIPYVMSAKESVDIDIIDDIATAERILGEKNGSI